MGMLLKLWRTYWTPCIPECPNNFQILQTSVLRKVEAVSCFICNIRRVPRVQPTTCYGSQFIYFCKTLYMFQTGFRPSSEAQNCTYSVTYLSDRYCYLLLAWPGWNSFISLNRSKWSRYVVLIKWNQSTKFPCQSVQMSRHALTLCQCASPLSCLCRSEFDVPYDRSKLRGWSYTHSECWSLYC